MEEIFSKEQMIIFNLAKQGLEKDAEIKLIKKDTERMLMEKDKDTEIKLIEKDMKLMEKEINKINLKKWW